MLGSVKSFTRELNSLIKNDKGFGALEENKITKDIAQSDDSKDSLENYQKEFELQADPLPTQSEVEELQSQLYKTFNLKELVKELPNVFL